MRYLKALPIVIAAGVSVAWGARYWQDTRPLGALTPSNVPQYLDRLAHSSRPDVVTLRRRVESGPADLAREKAAARREGIPIVPADLHAPRIPPGQDAAPLYAAFARLPPLSDETATLMDRLFENKRLSGPDTAHLRVLFNARPEYLGLLHRIAARPFCTPFRVFTFPNLNLPFEKFAARREMAKTLRAEGVLLALEGRAKPAADTEAMILRIAGHMYAEPSLIGYLVAVAIHAIGMAGEADVLDIMGPKAADAVRHAVAVNHPHPSLAWAFKGEMLHELAVLRFIRQDPDHLVGCLSSLTFPANAANPAARAQRLLTPAQRRLALDLVDANGARYVHGLRLLIPFLDAPYPAGNAASLRAATANRNENDPTLLFTGSNVPDLAVKTVERAAYSRAREATLLAGAAVLAFKNRTGAWPARLAQSWPAAPPDPFTRAAPLHYRREGAGFVVYSAGPDRTFNAPPSDHRNTGLFFRYPRPAGSAPH